MTQRLQLGETALLKRHTNWGWECSLFAMSPGLFASVFTLASITLTHVTGDASCFSAAQRHRSKLIVRIQKRCQWIRAARRSASSCFASVNCCGLMFDVQFVGMRARLRHTLACSACAPSKHQHSLCWSNRWLQEFNMRDALAEFPLACVIDRSRPCDP